MSSDSEYSVTAFLSHSGRDVDRAINLKNELAKFDIDVFVASRGITGGKIWRKELVEAIKRCSFFIVLLSENYHKGRYTDQEFGIAEALDKMIIPVSINDTRPYGLIEQHQYIRCDSESMDMCMKKLSDAIIRPKEIIDYTITQALTSDPDENTRLFERKLGMQMQFTNEQINTIAKKYTDTVAKTRITLLPHLIEALEKNVDRIEPDLKTKIQDDLKKERKLTKISAHKHGKYGPSKDDKYAVYLDLYKLSDIKIHRIDCRFIPQSSSQTTQWFFMRTYEIASSTAARLAKKFNMKHRGCMTCEPFNFQHD